MSALAEPFLIGTLASSLIVLSMSALAAQSANPSFDCGKARRPDEQTICKDSRLAELDQAVTIAFGQAAKGFKKETRDAAKETLKARRSCGTDRLCILDQQVKAIEEYSDLGSKVPVPPWVGTYRVDLFKSLPNLVGQCTITKIASISTRFGDPLNPPTEELDSSGSAVSFANEGYQVSYSYIQALADSHIGDDVLLCLVSLPKNCPPDDERGKFYSATNMKTKGSWLLPDSQHMCGGA